MTQIEKLKTAVAARPPVKSVWDFFESRKAEIARVLPKHVSTDRMIQVMTFMIKSNANLANASANSLIAAVIQASQCGLDPALNHCYFVPFNNKGEKQVQFIIGYKGYVEMMNRSKKAALIATESVYENDHFKYALGLNPVLEHTPTTGERGEFKGVYAIAKNIVADEKVFVYLTKEDVDKVRASSKAGKSEYSPWSNWYEEMAKKTAVRRLTKLLPLSVDEQKQYSADETTKIEIAPDMTSVPDITIYDNSSDEPEISAEPLFPKFAKEFAPEPELISEAQRKRMFAMLKNRNISDEAFKAYLMENFGIESRKEITKEMYVDISLWLEGGGK